MELEIARPKMMTRSKLRVKRLSITCFCLTLHKVSSEESTRARHNDFQLSRCSAESNCCAIFRSCKAFDELKFERVEEFSRPKPDVFFLGLFVLSVDCGAHVLKACTMKLDSLTLMEFA